MVVRPAEAEDRPQLLELIRGYFAFYRVPFPTDSKVEAMVDLLQRDPTLGVQLVAEEAGRLHGFASLYACLDTLIASRILVMNDLLSTRHLAIAAPARRSSKPAWHMLRRAVTHASTGSPPLITTMPSAFTIATAAGAVRGSPTARPSRPRDGYHRHTFAVALNSLKVRSS